MVTTVVLRTPSRAASARSSIWIERLTTDQKVGGSSPSGRATGIPAGAGVFGLRRNAPGFEECLSEGVADGGDVFVAVVQPVRGFGVVGVDWLVG